LSVIPVTRTGTKRSRYIATLENTSGVAYTGVPEVVYICTFGTGVMLSAYDVLGFAAASIETAITVAKAIDISFENFLNIKIPLINL
jgi:ribose 5-phosphate isomerase RpiB